MNVEKLLYVGKHITDKKKHKPPRKIYLISSQLNDCYEFLTEAHIKIEKMILMSFYLYCFISASVLPFLGSGKSHFILNLKINLKTKTNLHRPLFLQQQPMAEPHQNTKTNKQCNQIDKYQTKYKRQFATHPHPVKRFIGINCFRYIFVK